MTARSVNDIRREMGLAELRGEQRAIILTLEERRALQRLKHAMRKLAKRIA